MIFFEKKENLKVEFKKFKLYIEDFYKLLDNYCLCYSENFKDLRDKNTHKYILILSFKF